MATQIFSVPNQLTFLRLAFLPGFIIAIHYDHYDWALGILIAAALSDALDGVLARTLDQKTSLGAYLDPIADKLLLSTSFVILAVKGKVSWWVTILVLSRDVLILATAVVILLAVGYRPLPPSLYGKLCTVVQIAFVFLVVGLEVFHQAWLATTRDVFLYLAVALTVFSGLHYAVVIARRLSHPST